MTWKRHTLPLTLMTTLTVCVAAAPTILTALVSDTPVTSALQGLHLRAAPFATLSTTAQVTGVLGEDALKRAMTDAAAGRKSKQMSSGTQLLYTSSIGTGGKVITPIGGTSTSNFARALQIQADGKLVAAGNSTSNNGNDFALMRYTADGGLDMGFGKGGKVVTPVVTGQGDNVANALQIQADGKLVAAGFTSNAGGPTGYDFALLRYNANGSLDTGFGKGGKVITPVGGGSTADFATALQIQSDGKLVAAGYSTSADSGDDFVLVRYNANGSLDTGFGKGGKVITPVGGTNRSDVASALQVQSDGKLVVAGSTGDRANAASDFAVVRYNANGSLDTGFGTGGKVITAVGGANSANSASALQVRPDGKLVVAGYTGSAGGGSGYAFALVRYTTNGRLDTGFGKGGKAITPVGGTDSSAAANALQVQPDGKFVAAGYTRGVGRAANVHFALARYNANGSLDQSFGKGGTLTTSVGGTDRSDFATALQVQSDGKLIAAGYTGDSRGATGTFALVRYNTNGSLDTSFGAVSTVMTPEDRAVAVPAINVLSPSLQ